MRVMAILSSDGNFRVHHEDCSDIDKDRRRLHDVDEYPSFEVASQADVIKKLWADIIDDDPEFYATPEGFGTFYDATFFFRCTRGLPKSLETPAQPCGIDECDCHTFSAQQRAAIGRS